jgi:hypothetical protein
MTLYHKDIGFPPFFTCPDARINLIYTNHAKQASDSRNIRRLGSITLSRFQVIEIEVRDNRVVKMVVRGSYDATNDICLVITLEKGKWIVKTVWLNAVSDLHNTLDRSKYATV